MSEASTESSPTSGGDLIWQATGRVVADVGGRSSVGTAFVVGPHLLLTAMHVVADREAGVLAQSIQVHLPSAVIDASVVPELTDATADWAALWVVKAMDIEPLKLEETVAARAEFEALGFPHADGSEHWVLGHVWGPNGRLAGVPVLQLNSLSSGLDARGLSGAPVVVDGSVVGIVRSVYIDRDGLGELSAGTLYAVPVWLLAGPGDPRIPLASVLPPVDGELPEDPFPYLRPYGKVHAPVFFGRDRAIHGLLRAVKDGPRVIGLFGQSGVGKSSLLAAGLLPRLEGQVQLHRRDPVGGLLATLADADADLVVIDQAEEGFTSAPSPDPDRELREFAAAVGSRFGKDELGTSTLIVSFREAWLGRFKEALDPVVQVDWRRLDRLGPLEVRATVLGLRSRPGLTKKYGLTVEPGLPDAIATALRKDKKSPLAPSLQILLHRMWKKAKEKSKWAPRFDQTLYGPLANGGLGLDEFVTQTLEDLDGLKEGQRGLILDLLLWHSRPSSGVVRTLVSTAKRYPSLSTADLGALLAMGVTTRLLTEVGADWRLSHDALAGPVRAAFSASDRPAQRARRALEARAPSWRYGVGKPRVGDTLDGRDLRVVESGLAWMRTTTPAEEELIDASRRRRRITRTLAAAAMLAALIGGFTIVRLTLDAELGDQRLAIRDEMWADAEAQGLFYKAQVQAEQRLEVMEALPTAVSALSRAKDLAARRLYATKAMDLAIRAPARINRGWPGGAGGRAQSSFRIETWPFSTDGRFAVVGGESMDSQRSSSIADDAPVADLLDTETGQRWSLAHLTGTPILPQPGGRAVIAYARNEEGEVDQQELVSVPLSGAPGTALEGRPGYLTQVDRRDEFLQVDARGQLQIRNSHSRVRTSPGLHLASEPRRSFLSAKGRWFSAATHDRRLLRFAVPSVPSPKRWPLPAVVLDQSDWFSGRPWRAKLGPSGKQIAFVRDGIAGPVVLLGQDNSHETDCGVEDSRHVRLGSFPVDNSSDVAFAEAFTRPDHTHLCLIAADGTVTVTRHAGRYHGLAWVSGSPVLVRTLDQTVAVQASDPATPPCVLPGASGGVERVLSLQEDGLLLLEPEVGQPLVLDVEACAWSGATFADPPGPEYRYLSGSRLGDSVHVPLGEAYARTAEEIPESIGDPVILGADPWGLWELRLVGRSGGGDGLPDGVLSLMDVVTELPILPEIWLGSPVVGTGMTSDGSRVLALTDNGDLHEFFLGGLSDPPEWMLDLPLLVGEGVDAPPYNGDFHKARLSLKARLHTAAQNGDIRAAHLLGHAPAFQEWTDPEPSEPWEDEPSEPWEDEPSEPREDEPSEPWEDEPSEPWEDEPSEPWEDEPSEPWEDEPSERRQDEPSERREDEPSERREDEPSERREDEPSERWEDDPSD